MHYIGIRWADASAYVHIRQETVYPLIHACDIHIYLYMFFGGLDGERCGMLNSALYEAFYSS